MRQEHVTEYRINKKGAECFRSRSWEQTKEKFEALNTKRPGVYQIQHRNCHIDKHGVLFTGMDGGELWGAWM